MSNIKIGIVGLHQSGKSLLINCLLGRNISKVGDGNATTHTSVTYSFSKEEYANYKDQNGFHEVEVNDVKSLSTNESIDTINVFIDNPLLRKYTLIDLPGTGYNESDNVTTKVSLDQIDCAILVATNVKELTNASSFYTTTLAVLKQKEIPYFFVLNCVKKDYWLPKNKHNRTLLESNLELLQDYPPLFSDEDPIVNLMWYWCSIADESDAIYNEHKDSILDAFEHYKKAFNIESLRNASCFSVIEYIFSRESRLRLEFKKELKQKISTIKEQLCPVGTIQAFAFRKKPEEWLICDGRSLEIDDYPELFDAIGFVFGGNKRTRFQIPDLCGRFVRGWDPFGYVDNDRRFGSLQDDAIQEHNHNIPPISTNLSGSHDHRQRYRTDHYVGSNTFKNDERVYDIATSSFYSVDYNLSDKSVTRPSGEHYHNLPSSKTDSIIMDEKTKIASETRPKNIALLYCIKARSLNRAVSNRASNTVVDLNSLQVNSNGSQYEGFAILTYQFAIQRNGEFLNENINMQIFNGVSNETVFKGQVHNSCCLKAQEKGLHYLKYSYNEELNGNDKVANLVLRKIETIGIIGDFTNRNEPIKMNPDASEMIYSCTLKMKCGDKFKFRINNDKKLELGGDMQWLSFRKQRYLICQESGEYEITLDIHRFDWTCDIKKKSNDVTSVWLKF